MEIHSWQKQFFVTGSNSGFGRLTVETLARQGNSVFAGMREIAGKNASAAEELRTFAQRQAPEAVNEAAAHASRSYLEMLGVLPLVTLTSKAENNK